MSLHIPADVSNIIFDYYAQIKHMKWTPFIDSKTGNLKWKVNKYSAKYDNMNKFLKHRKENLPDNINIDVSVVMGGTTIDSYNATGRCIYLKNENYMNIPVSTFYIEYIDENSCKYSIFCLIFGRSSLHRFDYDIYQDGNIHSTLLNFHRFSYNTCSIIIEKY